MNRSARRELAFQMIYSLEIQKDIDNESVEIFIENNDIDDEIKDYLRKVATIIKENKEIIEEKIASNLKKDWTIDRISKIELAILKLAIYEIKYDDDIPYKVSINEAVELAKKYGESQSSSFVNGVLANVKKEN